MAELNDIGLLIISLSASVAALYCHFILIIIVDINILSNIYLKNSASKNVMLSPATTASEQR
jgi:hypothetical protein